MTGNEDLKLMAIAIQAAETGGRVLLDYWRKGTHSGVTLKSHADWVSDADRASEDAIISLLQEQTPGFDILTEEAGVIRTESRAGYRWIIDPLDGTTNFLRGFPIWAVSVALERRDTADAAWGQIVAGAITAPRLTDTFSAAQGSGAFRNGNRFQTAAGHPFNQSLLATGFPFRNRELLPGYFDLFKEIFSRCGDVRRAGAVAVDLCYTALGVYEGFWELDLGPWDIAAGALVITEAGGMVGDFQGGTTYLSSGDIVAGNAQTYQELTALARRFFPTPRRVEKSPNAVKKTGEGLTG